MDQIVSNFIRGRVVISLMMGVMFSIGWMLCGIQGAFILGMITGLLNIVPYLSVVGWPIAILLKFLQTDYGGEQENQEGPTINNGMSSNHGISSEESTAKASEGGIGNAAPNEDQISKGEYISNEDQISSTTSQQASPSMESATNNVPIESVTQNLNQATESSIHSSTQSIESVTGSEVGAATKGIQDSPGAAVGDATQTDWMGDWWPEGYFAWEIGDEFTFFMNVIFWPTFVYQFIQFLEGWLFIPLIQGKEMNLSTVTIIITILIGLAVGGIYGMLLCIPIAACIKILLVEVFLPRLEQWAQKN